MDGACFIYSIANAYVSLTGQRPKQEAWDNAIQRLPHAKDLLKGNVGTENFESLKWQAAMNSVLREFGGLGFRATPLGKMTSKSEIGKEIGRRSVVVFCWRQEHWVVGTAYDSAKKILYIACSAQLKETTANIPSLYTEAKDPLFGRHYNTQTSRNNLGCEDAAFRVERII